MRNLLKDSNFEEGFLIGHIDSIVYTGTMLEWKWKTVTPSWKICQWCSHFPLYENCQIETTAKKKSIFNSQKRVDRNEDGSVVLSIQTDQEYPEPRKAEDGWPHLLLEQFFEGIHLSSMHQLVMDIDFEFVDFKDHLGALRTPLHTFQVSWYLAVGNRNRASKGYSDFFWFGLPFIDHPRFDFPQSYRAIDGGKEDATNKFIIAIEPQKFLKEKTKVGNHYLVKFPALEEIKEAFAFAKKQGFLSTTNFEDLEIISTNFGIEDTGTFDGSLKINHIALWGDEKNE